MFNSICMTHKTPWISQNMFYAQDEDDDDSIAGGRAGATYDHGKFHRNEGVPFLTHGQSSRCSLLVHYENEVFDVKHSIALMINCLCVLSINHYFHETYWIWVKHGRHAFSHIRRLLIYWFSLSNFLLKTVCLTHVSCKCGQFESLSCFVSSGIKIE